jgi:hypothetical protein
MKLYLLTSFVAIAAFACGGPDMPPSEAPVVVAPDGAVVPVPSEDGELKEGEVEVETEHPDGSTTETEIEVDDD